MPSFIVYEIAAQGAEVPFAFVPEARDAHEALVHLHLSGRGFVARESHRAAGGDVLRAQYRMQVRSVAGIRPQRIRVR